MVNKVILIGNVGQDPDIRTMQNGDRVANLSIATSERWKDKATGEKKEKTEWHKVVVLNPGIIKLIEGYITKGTKLYVEGQLQTRKWQDKDGVDRYSTEVVLKPYKGEMNILSSKDRGNDAGGHDDYAAHNGHSPDYQTSTHAPSNDMDDDIPF